jgi:hypothetical protein
MEHDTMNAAIPSMSDKCKPSPTVGASRQLAAALVAVVLVSLTGCSAFQKATASSQWVEYPVQGTNTVEEALPMLCGHDRAILAKEAALMADVEGEAGHGFMAQDVNPAADVVRLYTLGTVRCSGPADIERRVVYDPATGRIETTIKTSNSDWIGSMFGGMWNAVGGIMSFIGQVAGGAGNKL